MEKCIVYIISVYTTNLVINIACNKNVVDANNIYYIT